MGRKVLIRTDSAGAAHDFAEWIEARKLPYSLGFTLPEEAVERLARIPATGAQTEKCRQRVNRSDQCPRTRRVEFRPSRRTKESVRNVEFVRGQYFDQSLSCLPVRSWLRSSYSLTMKLRKLALSFSCSARHRIRSASVIDLPVILRRWSMRNSSP
jgi:hypothetical protein